MRNRVVVITTTVESNAVCSLAGEELTKFVDIYFQVCFVTFDSVTVDAPVHADWLLCQDPFQMASVMPDINLAHWMRDLPEEVKHRPLTWVSIPGRHSVVSFPSPCMNSMLWFA